MNYLIIPVTQIRHDCLVLYDRIEFGRIRKGLQGINALREDEPKWESCPKKRIPEKKYTGEMTKGSIKRLKRAIDALISIAETKKVQHPSKDYLIKFKLNFITLTLPAPQGKITDKQISREVLKPFLKWLNYHHSGVSYIWKAETQKNGNIHYHITTDRFIHHQHIKDEWNHQLKKFGYIKEFAKKHGHSSPNSTDIHATHNIKNFKQYLVKYMCKKSDDRRKIEGKTWDCSRNLKSTKRAEVEIDVNLMDSLREYTKEWTINFKQTEHCTLIFITKDQWKAWLPPIIEERFEDWKNVIKGVTSTHQPPAGALSPPADAGCDMPRAASQPHRQLDFVYPR